jgi:hypothetical protein
MATKRKRVTKRRTSGVRRFAKRHKRKFVIAGALAVSAVGFHYANKKLSRPKRITNFGSWGNTPNDTRRDIPAMNKILGRRSVGMTSVRHYPSRGKPMSHADALKARDNFAEYLRSPAQQKFTRQVRINRTKAKLKSQNLKGGLVFIMPFDTTNKRVGVMNSRGIALYNHRTSSDVYKARGRRQ